MRNLKMKKIQIWLTEYWFKAIVTREFHSPCSTYNNNPGQNCWDTETKWQNFHFSPLPGFNNVAQIVVFTISIAWGKGDNWNSLK